ncbi:hypothetical protein IG631_23327 [Alternaria alternata]|nr:hypothetical protein IG631_23327 [Alternaria alternata]
MATYHKKHHIRLRVADAKTVHFIGTPSTKTPTRIFLTLHRRLLLSRPIPHFLLDPANGACVF